MTKKFINGDSENSKSEFVIPDIFDNQERFIGIDSGKVYYEGLVCYTGVDLTVNIVVARALENKSLSYFQKRKARKIIENYLAQIKRFKISNRVKIGPGLKLELVNK